MASPCTRKAFRFGSGCDKPLPCSVCLISKLLCQFEHRMVITVACIWLVNDDGEYEQTTDREFLLKYFEIDLPSDETNFYGTGK